MGFLRVLKLVAIALAVVLPVRAWVAEPVYVASPSMEPSFRVGTMLILDKLTFRMREPRRGDVISFRSPVEALDVVKRVVAVPGETVEIREKAVWVDGKPLEEPYKDHRRAEERLEGDTMEPLLVPRDSYFVLGDNRDESNDSSVWKDAEGKRIHFLRKSRVQGLIRRFPWAQ